MGGVTWRGGFQLQGGAESKLRKGQIVGRQGKVKKQRWDECAGRGEFGIQKKEPFRTQGAGKGQMQRQSSCRGSGHVEEMEQGGGAV